MALVALVAALVVGYGIRALDSGDSGGPQNSGSPTTSASASATVRLSELPSQASDTVALIRSRGPFPYPRNDGVVFHNNEHLLPRERDGYYREYTVLTPGTSDRGARRMITGAGGEFFYTADHYVSFRRVDPTR